MKKMLFLFICLFLIVPAFAEQAPQQISGNGRYVLIIHPQYRADQYLLDTKTGKIWQATVDESKNIYWQATRYHNADGTTKFMPQ